MRRLLLCLAVPLLLGEPGGAPWASAQGARQTADQTAIRRTFEAYRQALTGKRGEAAAAVVSRGTLLYYGRMRDLALRGSAAAVRALLPADKLMVLRMRQSMGTKTLQRMTPRQLFMHGVVKGWTGSEQVRTASIGGIRVQGSAAAAEFSVGGQRMEIPLRFVRESGAWKLDLAALMASANALMRRGIKQQGATEDTFVVGLLEQVTGKKVPATIWQPLVR